MLLFTNSIPKWARCLYLAVYPPPPSLSSDPDSALLGVNPTHSSNDQAPDRSIIIEVYVINVILWVIVLL